MAASDRPVGLDHHTAIPENFDPEEATCEVCGESRATHDVDAHADE